MSISRREFIRNLSIAGGGLTLGFTLSTTSAAQDSKDLAPDAFLRITPQGEIIVQIHKVEMGQGTVTGMVTLIAEELEVDPASVRYEMAGVDKAFRDPQYYLQITGGSNSTRVSYEPLRRTGATAKAMLLEAASQQSNIPQTDLLCENSTVRSVDGSVSFSYAELAAAAGKLKVPKDPPLKNPADFRLIGRQDQRLDNQPKVDGSAGFGIDAPVPEALVAVVVRPPVAQGKLVDFDAREAEALPGVKAIFAIDAGVAVVASNYWRARKAAEQVTVKWQASESPLLDSETIDRALDAALDGDDFVSIRNSGDKPEGETSRRLSSDYSVPFLAHATMEPMNATVAPGPDAAEVWVGTQAPDLSRAFAARALGLNEDKVQVHNQFLGGGFGRRAMQDHVYEAAQIARAIGKAVKLVWSREDDTRHDFYRPAMKARLQAELDANGKVQSWTHHLVGPSVLQWNIRMSSPAMLPAWIPDGLVNWGSGLVGDRGINSVEGAKDMPYDFGRVTMAYGNVETPVRLGAWRSVGHSVNAFMVESFVDELAHAAGEDPVAFRRRYLPQDSRHRQVLDKVAAMCDWGNSPPGRYRGVAVHESFHSVVAEVVEIFMAEGGPKLEQAWVAVHCGRSVNPDIVRQQMEGGMLFGLTAALKGEITLRDGAVVQGNFDDYPMLRMNEAPDIHVAIIDSDDPPTGVGEPATPPAPAALGNAIFAATGQRLRSLPFRLG